MNNFSQNTLAMGTILKSISGLAVWGFLIWTVYFSGYFELTLLNGVIIFIVLCIFMAFLMGIPFGITFAPVIFEWWILDVPLGSISTFAWAVTGVSLVANLFIVLGIASSD